MSAQSLQLNLRLLCTLVVVLLFPAAALHAQDPRGVTEPSFPGIICTTMAAQQSIVNGEPSSETTFDTSRLQSALNSCGSDEAVELTLGGTNNVNNAFLIQPISIPNGVTLIVDGGVTVFASRNPADYQATGSGVETCGTVGTAGNGCNPLITINNNATSSLSGIIGYGVINGRGGDDLIVNGVVQTYSWWALANQANTGSNAQNNFILLYAKNASDFTLYKITLMNSPMFHVKYQDGFGFTVWGVKIIAPYSARNTDGIDPDDSDSEITISNSYISDGDDNVALGATSGHPVSDVTIENTNTYAGHGISIGSNTAGGVSSVAVSNINMSGNLSDSNSAGLKIKSAANEGGVVSNVNYSNVCIQNIRYPIQFNPFYSSSSGTEYPSFQNIGLHNVSISTISNSTIELDGYNANFPLGLTMDNLNVTGTFALTPAPQYANITLGPGPVTPASLQTNTGTGVTYTGSITNPTEAAYACPATNFPFLAGELYLSTSTANNKQTITLAPGTAFTLNAVLEVVEASHPATTQPVVFYDGTTAVGTGTLGSNGTLASLTLSNVAPGTHTYTAEYSVAPYVDSSYPTLSFGSVTVTVSPTAATTTTITLSSASLPYGDPLTLTGTVNTGSSTTLATGGITFYDGSTRLGAGTIVNDSTSISISPLFSLGTHNIVATYSGDSNYMGSSSAAAPLTITQASTITYLSGLYTNVPYGQSQNFIAQIGPGTSATSGTPTGSVTFMDGTTPLGTVTLASATALFSISTLSAGTHSITVVYSGDSNYTGSTSQAQTLVINKAAITVVAGNATRAYGAANPAFTGIFTGVTAGDNITVVYSTLATATSAVGTYAITPTLVDPNGRLGNYNVTSTAGTLTVTAASSSVTLALSSAQIYANAPETLTATVASATGAPATGTVTFLNGSATLGTGTVTNGIATLTLTNLTAGSYGVTAAFANSNYVASTSSAVTLTVAAPVALGLGATSLSLAAGGTGSTTMTITPALGFTGAVTLACSSPVAYITCSVTSPVTISGTTAGTATINISVASSVASVASPKLREERTSATALAGLLPFGALLLIPLVRRRKQLLEHNGFRLLALLLLALGTSLALSGCGGGGGGNASQNLPPPGADTITITATANGAAVMTTLTVNVTN